MILLNYSHPITDEQRQQISHALNADANDELGIVDIPCHLNLDEPLAPQIVALVDACDFTSADWQGLRLVVNLPALSIVAAMLVAELHGRCGYYPPAVRLKRQSDVLPPVYILAEVIDLDDQRQDARERRLLPLPASMPGVIR